MYQEYIHRVIVNNKEVKRFSLLTYALDYRDKLRKTGIYAMVNTQVRGWEKK